MQDRARSACTRAELWCKGAEFGYAWAWRRTIWGMEDVASCTSEGHAGAGALPWSFRGAVQPPPCRTNNARTSLWGNFG